MPVHEKELPNFEVIRRILGKLPLGVSTFGVRSKLQQQVDGLLGAARRSDVQGGVVIIVSTIQEFTIRRFTKELTETVQVAIILSSVMNHGSLGIVQERRNLATQYKVGYEIISPTV